MLSQNQQEKEPFPQSRERRAALLPRRVPSNPFSREEIVLRDTFFSESEAVLAKLQAEAGIPCSRHNGDFEVEN